MHFYWVYCSVSKASFVLNSWAAAWYLDPSFSLGEMKIGDQLGPVIRNMLVHNWADENLNELSMTITEKMDHKKVEIINVPNDNDICKATY